MTERPSDASCARCVHGEPFTPKPDVGPQDPERTLLCGKHGFAVGVEFCCPQWKATA